MFVKYVPDRTNAKTRVLSYTETLFEQSFLFCTIRLCNDLIGLHGTNEQQILDLSWQRH